MGQQDKIVIFDTTLRDGEQSPGASMTGEEKIRIAKALERLKVDVIEAGFPAASPGDFEAVRAVAEQIQDSTICGLSRAVEKDIIAAGEALKPAQRGRIHTFIATSPVHMEHKLHMTPEQVLERAVWAVKKAREFTDDVEFSPEDAGRSDFEFLCRVVEAVIAAGATTVNLPDTVGYNVPEQFGYLFKRLIEAVPNSDKATFSSHCHNDLGLAVANSLAAVANGARQVECTINGLGERAGNAALEEIVMAIKTRADYFNCRTTIDTRQLTNCSRLVSSITGFSVQPNKAIVGANAFAHEAGIHQDGVLKSRETYEIMRAEDVGLSKNKIVLGKHSGRNALKVRLQELGLEPQSDGELQQLFVRFKDLADKKHEIFDEDLQALYSDIESAAQEDIYQLVEVDVTSGNQKTPKAYVLMSVDGETQRAEAEGVGVVDAVFKAIEKIVASETTLKLYSVNAITSGTDSQGDVTVRLAKGDRIANGQGADTDIVMASAKAYVQALNIMSASPMHRTHPHASL